MDKDTVRKMGAIVSIIAKGQDLLGLPDRFITIDQIYELTQSLGGIHNIGITRQDISDVLEDKFLRFCQIRTEPMSDGCDNVSYAI